MTGHTYQDAAGPVYITKYALTAGILKVSGFVFVTSHDDGAYVDGVFVPAPGAKSRVYVRYGGQLHSSKDYALTEAEAVKQAKAKAFRKAESLKTKLRKLKDFEPVIRDCEPKAE